MSVSSEIQRIKTNIENAYQSAESKGATMPDIKNSNNLANTISSIVVGSTQENKLTSFLKGTLKDITAEDFGDSTTIQSYAFYYNDFIESIEIPTSIQFIESNAFGGSPKIKKIYYLGSINDYVRIRFSDISSNPLRITGVNLFLNGDKETPITSVTISKDINDYAFSGATCIESVVIDEGVSIIGMYAFSSCKSLTDLTINNGIETIGSYAFRLCTGLTSLVIPDSVQNIHTYCFFGCENIESITLSNSLTLIPTYAFHNCKKLGMIVFPDSIATISGNAFELCSSMTEVIFGNGISSLQGACFNGCNNVLKYDFSKATKVPTLQSTYAFNKINSNCKIYVPDSLYDEWVTSTNWVTYSSYIVKSSEMEV